MSGQRESGLKPSPDQDYANSDDQRRTGLGQMHQHRIRQTSPARALLALGHHRLLVPHAPAGQLIHALQQCSGRGARWAAWAEHPQRDMRASRGREVVDAPVNKLLRSCCIHLSLRPGSQGRSRLNEAGQHCPSPISLTWPLLKPGRRWSRGTDKCCTWQGNLSTPCRQQEQAHQAERLARCCVEQTSTVALDLLVGGAHALLRECCINSTLDEDSPTPLPPAELGTPGAPPHGTPSSGRPATGSA